MRLADQSEGSDNVVVEPHDWARYQARSGAGAILFFRNKKVHDEVLALACIVESKHANRRTFTHQGRLTAEGSNHTVPIFCDVDPRLLKQTNIRANTGEMPTDLPTYYPTAITLWHVLVSGHRRGSFVGDGINQCRCRVCRAKMHVKQC